MSDDVIVMNEVMNDGKTVHLHYSEMFQEYVAYGFSAYIVCRTIPPLATKAHLSYSDQLQMPMVRVDAVNLKILKQKVAPLETADAHHLTLTVSIALNEYNYTSWASIIRG